MRELVHSYEFKRSMITSGLSAFVAALVAVPLALIFSQASQHANALSSDTSPSTSCAGTASPQTTTSALSSGQNTSTHRIIFASAGNGGSFNKAVFTNSSSTNSSNNTGNFGDKGVVNVPVNVSGNTVLSNNTVSALNGSVDNNTVNALSNDVTTTSLTLLKDPTTIVSGTDIDVPVLSTNTL